MHMHMPHTRAHVATHKQLASARGALDFKKSLRILQALLICSEDAAPGPEMLDTEYNVAGG